MTAVAQCFQGNTNNGNQVVAEPPACDLRVHTGLSTQENAGFPACVCRCWDPFLKGAFVCDEMQNKFSLQREPGVRKSIINN